jgi:predicted glycosyltransferase
MQRLRVLFYAVDGLGLGHVTRLLAIARALRRLRPEAECVFLSASEADWIIYKEGFVSFKVPSRTARAAAGLTPSRHARTVQSVTWTLVNAFDPHVLVVDTFPAGTLQELLPLLRWPINKVFVFREQQPRLAADAYLQETLRLYQLVVVPHTLGELEIPLPAGVAACWSGPILLRERGEALPRAAAERLLALPTAPHRLRLYINFGGGGDRETSSLLQTALAAAALVPELDPVVAPGPLARDDPPLPAGVTAVHHYPIADCLAAFDVALSAAGYNAVHEVLHHGLPAVLVAVGKGVDDQDARVRRAVAAGAALGAEASSTDVLAGVLRRLLDPLVREALARRAQTLVPGGGAEAAARAIVDLKTSG